MTTQAEDQAAIDQKLSRFESQLIDLNRQLLLIQRVSIPKYLRNARWYFLNATSINASNQLQSQELVRVTTIVAYTTSPGRLVIQDRNWPINGFQILQLQPDGVLIAPTDQVILTQTTGGEISLEFLGQELPNIGQRW